MASFQSVILKFLIRKTINWNKPLMEVRKDLARISKKAKIPKDIDVFPVITDDFRGEWIVPSGALEENVIIYLHGGGYCLGIVNTNRGFVARVAKESGIKVLLVDYRLAPENPYPAAIEDAAAAYRWLLGEGFQPKNIVFMADSSGCGLSLASLFMLRNNGVPMPASLIFMSPTVDFTYTGESMKTKAKVDPYQMDPRFFIANYYMENNDPASSWISPLYGDFYGLPPMLIHGSECDIFLSDAVRLAEKAKNAGVDVTLKVWDKMWHIFHMSADLLPEGRAALREIYGYIKKG
ncbi:MAG: alpha/beta hydrolase [Clostridia bacterium]|nr:alpha/beta hydrolase [Clostridia bacterium]